MSRIIFIIIVYLIIKNENKNYINKYGKDIYLKAKKEIQEQKIVSYLIIIMKACLIIVSVFLVPGIIGGALWMLFMLITLGMASLASSESPFGHLTQFLEFDFQIIKSSCSDRIICFVTNRYIY